MTPLGDVTVTARARSPLSAAQARRLAQQVLEAERTDVAALSISFVGTARIRSLNRDHLGHDRETDVIAFAYAKPLVGDIYICPPVAAKNAREVGVTARDEVRRLVVHGVLHVLGYDHPDGARRMTSPMWRRQERYLSRFAR